MRLLYLQKRKIHVERKQSIIPRSGYLDIVVSHISTFSLV